MRIKYFVLILLSLAIYSCINSQTSNHQEPEVTNESLMFNEYDSNGMTIEYRYNPPEGFERVAATENSFARFLRNLPLKRADSEVTLYNGTIKHNYDVYSSVVDLEIGNKNLHQCADAVIRLRADYFRSIGKSNQIKFSFTNGFVCDYSNWMKGRNVIVSGNQVHWSTPGNSRVDNDENYWKYLEKVFTYAGTLSLSRELKKKSIHQLEIGDIFIQGGSPGHAIIIVDLVQNPETNEKRFLLAQSYMPAQEIQILQNPNYTTSSWFSIPEDGILKTPEWTFHIEDLMSFRTTP